MRYSFPYKFRCYPPMLTLIILSQTLRIMGIAIGPMGLDDLQPGIRPATDNEFIRIGTKTPDKKGYLSR